MKYLTKEEAEAAANTCRSMMSNPDVWEIEVFEGIGWRFNIIYGFISITQSFVTDKYVAYIYRDKKHIGGMGEWDWHERERFDRMSIDPNHALSVAYLQYTDWYINKMNKLKEYNSQFLLDMKEVFKYE